MENFNNTDFGALFPNKDCYKAFIAENLTSQEQKILQLVLHENSNKEISAILNISIFTVKKHRENIIKKFNLSGRIEVRKFFNKINLHFSNERLS